VSCAVSKFIFDDLLVFCRNLIPDLGGDVYTAGTENVVSVGNVFGWAFVYFGTDVVNSEPSRPSTTPCCTADRVSPQGRGVATAPMALRVSM